ncbi:MAG: hypothetical protein R3A52_28510 [Polyangiales bacterium]
MKHIDIVPHFERVELLASTRRFGADCARLALATGAPLPAMSSRTDWDHEALEGHCRAHNVILPRVDTAATRAVWEAFFEGVADVADLVNDPPGSGVRRREGHAEGSAQPAPRRRGRR